MLQVTFKGIMEDKIVVKHLWADEDSDYWYSIEGCQLGEMLINKEALYEFMKNSGRLYWEQVLHPDNFATALTGIMSFEEYFSQSTDKQIKQDLEYFLNSK